MKLYRTFWNRLGLQNLGQRFQLQCHGPHSCDNGSIEGNFPETHTLEIWSFTLAMLYGDAYTGFDGPGLFLWGSLKSKVYNKSITLYDLKHNIRDEIIAMPQETLGSHVTCHKNGLNSSVL